jgi:hypothetical protein
LNLVVRSLVILFNIRNPLANGLSRHELTIRPLSNRRGNTPEKVVRLLAQVEKVEAVPVLLHFPDEVLIGIEFSRMALVRRASDLDGPQVVGEMKKSPRKETRSR